MENKIVIQVGDLFIESYTYNCEGKITNISLCADPKLAIDFTDKDYYQDELLETILNMTGGFLQIAFIDEKEKNICGYSDSY